MRIETTVFSGNLIGSATGVDEMASARRYVDLLGAQLEQKYPDADVDVFLARAEGVPPPTRVWVGDENDAETAFDVDDLADLLWQHAEQWAVDDLDHPATSSISLTCS